MALFHPINIVFLSQATGFNFPSILVSRVFLGAFEAGFSPQMTLYYCRCLALFAEVVLGLNSLFFSLILYQGGIGTSGKISLLAYWFMSVALHGFQLAFWFGFAAIAGAFGGLVAFGIQHIHSSVQNWRLLFIIEVRFKLYT